jgi:glycerophosphoryl diester phosphodiesterase
VLLVAHRTPPSSAQCARLAAAGATIFEIDVQLGRGRIAVSHFLPVGRGGYLQRDNWRWRWHTAAARDPAVDDVAAVVPPGCAVLLDLKERTAERRRELISAIVETMPERKRYVVCGPHPEDLQRLRAAGFRTWRTVGGRRSLAALLADGPIPDEAISIRHTLLTEASIDRLQDVTETVVAWTVNDPGRARQLRDLGVSGITTDRPAVMQSVAAGPQVGQT